MSRIVDVLPALYTQLFPAFFQRPVPEETKATCGDCAMCEGKGAQSWVKAVDGSSRAFRPDTKCCTYHPRLPNYLVGAMLSDERPELAEGRARLGAKVDGRLGTSPQWLEAPAKFTLVYRSARNAFGRSESLLCPYYERKSGNCTIWPYREAVCSTFFCKYVAGEDGRSFWMSLKTYLTLAEIQLSRWAVFQLLPDYVLERKDRPDRDLVLGPSDVDEAPLPESAYRALWGEWAERERAFYARAYELVRGLGAGDLERMLGLDGTLEQAVLERLYRQATAPELPRTLRFNPAATVSWLPDGSVGLGAYSEYDAVALPGAAYELLVRFTGQEPVAEVRRKMREEKQADVDEGILLELYRHRILIAA
jgi:hypothetical protein